MTIEELLALKNPEDVFPGDADGAKRLYRELAKAWHPDKPGGNVAAFEHLSGLYRGALDKLARGTWNGATTLVLQEASGRECKLSVLASAPFELGQALVGSDFAAYLIEPDHTRFAQPACNLFVNFRYVNEKMREEFQRYLPQKARTAILVDGRCLVHIAKTPDLIKLRDVVTHAGGLDPKHVAWIVSGMLNLACYLSHAQLIHHDISPDTYFISPEFHSGALLGGWWYAKQRGSKVGVIPRRTFESLPFKVKITKQASSLTDLELIRLTARECLRGQAAPQPMWSWLCDIAHGSALDQYREWIEVLKQTFGPRRFTALSINADAVYGTKGRVQHG